MDSMRSNHADLLQEKPGVVQIPANGDQLSGVVWREDGETNATMSRAT